MNTSINYSILSSSPAMIMHVLAWYDGQDVELHWGEHQDQLRSCIQFLLHHGLLRGILLEDGPVLPYGLIFQEITPKGYGLLEECRRWDLLKHAIAV